MPRPPSRCGSGHRELLARRCCGRPSCICKTLFMRLKTAALLALIGMILLTVLLAVGFVRDASGFLSGAVAPMTAVASLVHLLASLGLAVFMCVFHRAQS